MTGKELVKYLWSEMGKQHWNNVRACFTNDAAIRWYNTNEAFNAEEFILVNSKYPGNWDITVERLEQFEDMIISVAYVKSLDNNASCYATSFFNIKNDKIFSLDEYWGDNDNPPQWRIDMKIGKPIKI